MNRLDIPCSSPRFSVYASYLAFQLWSHTHLYQDTLNKKSERLPATAHFSFDNLANLAKSPVIGLGGSSRGSFFRTSKRDSTSKLPASASKSSFGACSMTREKKTPPRKSFKTLRQSSASSFFSASRGRPNDGIDGRKHRAATYDKGSQQGLGAQEQRQTIRLVNLGQNTSNLNHREPPGLQIQLPVSLSSDLDSLQKNGPLSSSPGITASATNTNIGEPATSESASSSAVSVGVRREASPWSRVPSGRYDGPPGLGMATMETRHQQSLGLSTIGEVSSVGTETYYDVNPQGSLQSSTPAPPMDQLNDPSRVLTRGFEMEPHRIPYTSEGKMDVYGSLSIQAETVQKPLKKPELSWFLTISLMLSVTAVRIHFPFIPMFYVLMFSRPLPSQLTGWWSPWTGSRRRLARSG